MSTESKPLAATLFGITRRAVLSLLYDNSDKAYYLREIVRMTGVGLGAAQRELSKLTAAGAVRRSVRGRQVYYQANTGLLLFRELKSLVASPLQGGVVAEPATQYPEVTPPAAARLRVAIPRRKLGDFCRRHHIRKLALFGSVLRGDFSPESDVDVLVEFENGHTPGFAFIDIQEELSKMIGRKVDLNTPEDLSPYFRDRVVNEAKVLYDAG